MRIPTLLAVAAIAAFAVVLWQLLGVQDSLERQQQEARYGPANVLTLTDAVLQHSDNGELRLMVWAEKAVYAEDAEQTLLEAVRFRVFPAANGGGIREMVEGTAGFAQLDRKSKLLLLKEGVHILHGGQIEFRGRQLDYRYDKGLLTTRHPIWVKQHGTVHQGSGMEYDMAEQRLIIQQPRIYR